MPDASGKLGRGLSSSFTSAVKSERLVGTLAPLDTPTWKSFRLGFIDSGSLSLAQAYRPSDSQRRHLT